VSDLLIRDVPDDVLAVIDARASRLGLSRTEYLRRRLAQDASVEQGPVSVDDLARFATAFGDLSDPEVMGGAWR
jgi:plasmid stability protein